MLDLFSGSGVVSSALAQVVPVTAVDVQEYARVLASAAMSPSHIAFGGLLARSASRFNEVCSDANIGRLLDNEGRALAGQNLELIAQCVEHGSIAAGALGADDSGLRALAGLAAADLNRTASGTTIFRYYGGVYFSYRQSLELDMLAAEVRELPREARDSAMAALLATASALVTSVGSHFAQPPNVRQGGGAMKPKAVRSVAQRRLHDTGSTFAAWARRYNAIVPTKFDHEARREDVLEYVKQLPSDVGCAYADPPYTRDHYSRFYHVLETIATGVEEPGISMTTRGSGDLPSRGLYPLQRFQSGFSIVSRAPVELASLGHALAREGVPLVLSYSPVPETDKPRQRVLSIPQLLEILDGYYAAVEVWNVDGVRHSRLNSRALSASRIAGTEEILVLARP